ncbi:TIGR03086 family metal-binding protein [Streptomyces endophyticus]|uniref:TIGR03086 family metal-binding protein n=1 Tax=Streptomyces endophyticus TaxID=714166 RepID=A0ABU6F1G9_9ACTN|nr:TIGR03086 family metal-binding protein [Streptomyces endophyticus]MEB8337837.1 TIGR03086 family metal-binding protein [Streptomyces endophyticus]
MIDLKPACGRMTDVLAGVSDEQLSRPTPCSEYSVRELIAHVDDAARAFTGFARKEAPLSSEAGDWRVSTVKSVRALGDAWDDPEAWRGETDGPGFTLPNDTWGKVALTEMVVHGWDLAKATGQPFDLPEETLLACHDHVSGFVTAAPLPELWGPPVETPADAPLMDRIVGFTGRRP